jgi:hypothetical protein
MKKKKEEGKVAASSSYLNKIYFLPTNLKRFDFETFFFLSQKITQKQIYVFIYNDSKLKLILFHCN